MNRLHEALPTRQRGAALLIVLAFVVLLTGVSVAYLSRTTGDRQVAHGSFYQSNVDQLAQSAMDSIIGDLRQEIANGSTAYAQADGTTLYVPRDTGAGTAANMVPQRSGNRTLGPNLMRGLQLRQVAPQPLTRRRTRLLLGGLLLSRVGTRTTYSQKPTLSTTTAIRQVPCWLRSIPTRRFRTALPHQIGFLLLPRKAQSSRLLTTLLLGDTPMQFTTKAGCSI